MSLDMWIREVSLFSETGQYVVAIEKYLLAEVSIVRIIDQFVRLLAHKED